MNKPDEELELRMRPRAKEMVSINIPKDTLNSLKKIASGRDMSYQALIKFYIGQGLRQDLTKRFADSVLETTAQVLSRRLQSEKEVSEIIQEIRVEAVG